MTDSAEDPPAKRRMPMRLVMSVLLALGGGAAGFGLVQAGLISIGGSAAGPGTDDTRKTVETARAFVPLDPVMISLSADGGPRHLKFAAQLEVDAGQESAVSKLRPRIADVMNSYLRAVEVSDLTDAPALIRVRGHLLRRIQVVAGDLPVRDVLVTEFVLN